ncbi:glycosyltransferase family 4 protein [Clostridium frigidicarnis]|uniref:Glycosyltransferase involved in cell wall bisynthesis n=1 Tax=Clostridium frigidicarnis TaxID=84698 RepID=A0A1I0ZGG7_9CLOT|nr:glycosyltransferase family 1 protein [Clostridium frigidicarnis]SFB24462.1 Glycosyltransferase involved in cell wall bisynthesis [Clostridium frigidicarnis]
MKIAIDARPINWYRGTGIGTYTENLLNSLLNIDQLNKYYLYWSLGNYDSFKKSNSEIIMTSRRHHKFFQEDYFPNHLRKEDIDLFMVPQNGIGLLGEGAKKYVVTIHDLIPYTLPETVGKGYLTKFIKEMPSIIEKSNGILTVSEHSKKDILKFFPVDENKIYVTPLAANSNYTPYPKDACKSYLKETFGIDKNFILYVGGFSTRKNVRGLIDAFKQAKLDNDYILVLPGSVKDEGEKLKDYVKSINMDKKVYFLGYCAEETLATLYSLCSLFVYPSFYEGFGLPVLEAMCCGAPVLCSNLTSIPEVIGDGGMTFNPYSTDEMIMLLENILNNSDVSESLSRYSLERSSNFSWNKTAKLTLDALNNIYESC